MANLHIPGKRTLHKKRGFILTGKEIGSLVNYADIIATLIYVM